MLTDRTVTWWKDSIKKSATQEEITPHNSAQPLTFMAGQHIVLEVDPAHIFAITTQTVKIPVPEKIVDNFDRRQIPRFKWVRLPVTYPHLGCAILHLGCAMLHLGSAILHLGCAILHLGFTIPHLGSAILHLGLLCYTWAILYLGSAILHLGYTILHLYVMWYDFSTRDDPPSQATLELVSSLSSLSMEVLTELNPVAEFHLRDIDTVDDYSSLNSLRQSLDSFNSTKCSNFAEHVSLFPSSYCVVKSVLVVIAFYFKLYYFSGCQYLLVCC